ncbi:MAG: hypothetical protein CVV06_02920 [Gammaproteobacteria bacterium HGW-Gammaproteobacteria-10]|nr:MAG: hypothetical protein CVV06_02920 [Gammaproteobacteria bacterium HGW-Gammaproteobacteria-10]
MSKKDKLAAHEAMVKPVSEQAAKRVRIHGSTKAVPDNDDFFEGMLEGLQDAEFYEESVIAPPQPTPAMFYGFIGEVAKVAADGTEINPVAAAVVFLSFLGANAGGDSFYRIGNKVHHPLLFTLHIGRSGRGRKGDSQQIVHRIRQRIEERDSALLGNFHSTGLSSREGLATLIHDGFGDSPAIADKRLWIIESEFANVLHQAKREGNTLSSAIREVWDGGGIKPATKSKPVGVTNPLIGVHANITPAELNGLLNAREMSNGFANRFLMIWAEKTKSVAYPKPTPEAVINDLAEQAEDVIRFAKGGYPNRKNGLEMHLSKAARDYWGEAYLNLDKPLESDFLNEILERRAPYAIRLAMLFALADQTRVIEVAHLEAALTWIAYAVQTVKYVFADQASNPRQLETRQNASKILAFLRLRPEGASKWNLNDDCFQKHCSGEKIDAALRFLLAEIPPKIEQTKVRTGQRGPLATRYKLKNSAESFFNSPSRATPGAEAVLQPAESLRRVSAKVVEIENSPQFSAIDENTESPEKARPSELKKLSAPFRNTSNGPPAKNRPRKRQ